MKFSAVVLSSFLFLSATGIAATHSSIVNSGVVILDSAISFRSLSVVGELRTAADAVRETTKEVLLVVNSPGGVTLAADRIFSGMDHIRASGVKINCHVTDMAASAAFMLLMHCDKRTASGSSLLMAHRPYLVIPKDTPIRTKEAAQILESANLFETKYVHDFINTFSAILSAESYSLLKSYFENETVFTPDMIQYQTVEFSKWLSVDENMDAKATELESQNAKLQPKSVFDLIFGQQVRKQNGLYPKE